MDLPEAEATQASPRQDPAYIDTLAPKQPQPESVAEERQLLKGRYRIGKRIGAGGMGTILEAKDTQMDRMVALKVLHIHLAKDQVMRKRFAKEATNAATLSHQNVVAVYDQGCEDLPWIVMELVDGPSLRQVLIENGPLTPHQALSVIAPLADALGKAHTKGLVHRDIKPENVLITKDGIPKLADFGIAKLIEHTSHTDMRTLVGSVHYLAPELVQGYTATSDSDQYALAVMLFELLTNRKPLPADTPMAIALRHANEEVPLPSQFNAEVTKELDAVVRKATSINPAHRYPTLLEFQLALHQAIPGESAPVLTEGHDASVVRIMSVENQTLIGLRVPGGRSSLLPDTTVDATTALPTVSEHDHAQDDLSPVEASIHDVTTSSADGVRRSAVSSVAIGPVETTPHEDISNGTSTDGILGSSTRFSMLMTTPANESNNEDETADRVNPMITEDDVDQDRSPEEHEPGVSGLGTLFIEDDDDVEDDDDDDTNDEIWTPSTDVLLPLDDLTEASEIGAQSAEGIAPASEVSARSTDGGTAAKRVSSTDALPQTSAASQTGTLLQTSAASQTGTLPQTNALTEVPDLNENNTQELSAQQLRERDILAGKRPRHWWQFTWPNRILRWTRQVIIVGVIAFLGWFIINHVLFPSVPIPNYVGIPVEVAKQRITARGQLVEVTSEHDTDYPPGVVLAQDPPAHRPVKTGAIVTLTVASGGYSFTMPELKGQHIQTALLALQAYGAQPNIEQVKNSAPPGTVIRQSIHAGTKIASDTTITLTIAQDDHTEFDLEPEALPIPNE